MSLYIYIYIYTYIRNAYYTGTTSRLEIKQNKTKRIKTAHTQNGLQSKTNTKDDTHT
jgi:hypothetical protein